MNGPVASLGRRCGPQSTDIQPLARTPADAGGPFVAVQLVVFARFLAWATAQDAFPTAESAGARFAIRRSVADQWLDAVAEAYGFERTDESPSPHEGQRP